MWAALDSDVDVGVYGGGDGGDGEIVGSKSTPRVDMELPFIQP